MNSGVHQLSEFVKNSIGKELNNSVPIFLSGTEFCNAVQSLRNSAFYGKWFFSYPPNEVAVVGSPLNLHPLLVFSLLGKTVAVVDLSDDNSIGSPAIDVLFDEVFLSGGNLDAVSVNSLPGALTFVDDVPDGGVVVGSTLNRHLLVYNNLPAGVLYMMYDAGEFEPEFTIIPFQGVVDFVILFPFEFRFTVSPVNYPAAVGKYFNIVLTMNDGSQGWQSVVVPGDGNFSVPVLISAVNAAEIASMHVFLLNDLGSPLGDFYGETGDLFFLSDPGSSGNQFFSAIFSNIFS